MKFLFWNVRGLGKSHRRSLVRNHILNENLDLVALQETIKQDFEDWELKELAGNIDFNWLWTPARVYSGGMIMGVRVESFEVEDSVFEILYGDAC